METEQDIAAPPPPADSFLRVRRELEARYEECGLVAPLDPDRSSITPEFLKAHGFGA